MIRVSGWCFALKHYISSRFKLTATLLVWIVAMVVFVWLSSPFYLNHILTETSVKTNDNRVHGDKLANMFKVPIVELYKVTAQLNKFKSILMSHLHELTLQKRQMMILKGISNNSLTVKGKLINSDPDYFRKLAMHVMHPRIKTIFFEPKFSALADTLSPVYFSPISNNEKLIASRIRRGVPRSLPNNFNLSEEIGMWASKPLPADMPFLHPKPVQLIYHNMTHTKGNTSFIHIVRNATIMPGGDVYVGHLRIVPDSCPPCQGGYRRNYQPATSFKEDEVLSIAECWGQGFYHGTLENLPRLMPYLQFIKDNPNIKVHVIRRHPFLTSLLGLAPSRLVTGGVTSKMVYMPAGTPCGQSPIFTTQLLSLHLRHSTHALSQKPLRHYVDTIVLQKRSTRRFFRNHGAIFDMLQKVASKWGLSLVVHDDRHLPRPQAAGEMFQRTLLMVAPHGAGISNMLFAQPGTILIEGLCYTGGRLNNCYRSMAYHLGLRYCGVVFQKQCMDITAKDLHPIVENTLHQLAMAQNNI